MIQPASVYASRHIGNVQVIATSRHGGLGSGVFGELNLGGHVGDDPDVVSANRAHVRDLVSARELVFMEQFHSDVVHRVTTGLPVTDGDGIVTTQSDIALAAFGADCVTFALVDPVAQVIAAGHSGWKGLAVGLPDALVQEFFAAGAQASNSTAVIGPAICGTCYEVSAERVEVLGALCPEAIVDSRHIDVTEGVVSVLDAYGIKTDVLGGCTFEDPDLYSFRRDGVTGRSALVVVMNQEPLPAA